MRYERISKFLFYDPFIAVNYFIFKFVRPGLLITRLILSFLFFFSSFRLVSSRLFPSFSSSSSTPLPFPPFIFLFFRSSLLFCPSPSPPPPSLHFPPLSPLIAMIFLDEVWPQKYVREKSQVRRRQAKSFSRSHIYFPDVLTDMVAALARRQFYPPLLKLEIIQSR